MSFLQPLPAFSHEPEPFRHEMPNQQFQASQEVSFGSEKCEKTNFNSSGYVCVETTDL